MKRTIGRTAVVAALAIAGLVGIQSAAIAKPWIKVGTFGAYCNAIGEQYMSTGDYRTYHCIENGDLWLVPWGG